MAHLLTDTTDPSHPFKTDKTRLRMVLKMLRKLPNMLLKKPTRKFFFIDFVPRSKYSFLSNPLRFT
jgi:hypothetical protein